MNCSICGAEISTNDKCCSNCGTRVMEMPAASNHAAFGSNPQAMDMAMNSQTALKNKGSSRGGHKVLVSVIVILLILAGTFGFFYFRYFTAKTFDLDGFSIELPRAMKLDDDAETGNILSAGAMQADKYACAGMNFSYVSMDFSSIASDSLFTELTEEDFAKAMSAQLKASSGNADFELISQEGNVIKTKATNSENQEKFGYMVCEIEGANIYLLHFESLYKYKDFYEDYFEDWAASIDFE